MRKPTAPTALMQRLRWLVLVRVWIGFTVYAVCVMLFFATQGLTVSVEPSGFLFAACCVAFLSFLLTFLVGGVAIAIIELVLAIFDLVPRLVPYAALIGGAIAIIVALPYVLFWPDLNPDRISRVIVWGPILMILVGQSSAIAGAWKYARVWVETESDGTVQTVGKLQFGIGHLASLTALSAAGFALSRLIVTERLSVLLVVVAFWAITFGMIVTLSKLQSASAAISQLAPIIDESES